MSNPWKEIFEDIRFENGNDYFYQSLNEEEEGGVSSSVINSAVQKIKRIAKRDNVRIQVAMTTFFANTRLSPSERAAIRNKIAEFNESYEYEIDENVQSIATGYQRADRNTARSLGAAQTIQQRIDARRNQANQQKKRLTTGGAPTQFGENLESETELVEKAVSAAQQRFMGMVYAAKKGKMKAPSAEVEKAAASMSTKEAKKFAKTKHKGLPEKVTKEDFEAFIEEKYGEKYEKNYKKTGKKSKDYDGDGTVEDEADEYAGVKDRAIKAALKKKVLNNSFSDWRSDLNLINEKRYAASPWADINPAEKSSETDPDKKAASLRQKPKSSQVSEETNLANLLAEGLGGKLIEANVASPIVSSLERSLNKPVLKMIPGGGVPTRAPMAQKLKPQFRVGTPPAAPKPSITAPKVVSSAEKATSQAATQAAERTAAQAGERATARVATQAAERGGAKLLGKTFSRLIPGLNVAMAGADAAEKLKRGDTLGATLAAASAAPGPVGWAALGLGTLRDLTTPEKLPEPVKTPKPKPTTSPVSPKTKPSVQPQGQPETQTTTKVKPTGSKVKFPTGATTPTTTAQTQTQTQTQGQGTKTAVGTKVTTKQDTEDQNKRKRDKISLDLKTPGQGQGNIYQAVSL